MQKRTKSILEKEVIKFQGKPLRKSKPKSVPVRETEETPTTDVKQL